MKMVEAQPRVGGSRSIYDAFVSFFMKGGIARVLSQMQRQKKEIFPPIKK